MKFTIHTTKRHGALTSLICETSIYDEYANARCEFLRLIESGEYESAQLKYEVYDHPVCFGSDPFSELESWRRDRVREEKMYRLLRDGEYFYDTIAGKFIEPTDVPASRVEHVKC